MELNTSAKPQMTPFKRHIFVCVGEKCAAAGVGHEVYDYLKERLRQGSADPDLKLVKRSQSECLRTCQGGPISVVYPEGVWYCHLTKEKVDRILEEHLKKGNPVKEWVFFPPQ